MLLEIGIAALDTADDHVKTPQAAVSKKLGTSIHAFTTRVQGSASNARDMARQAKRSTETVRELAQAAGRISGVVGLIRRVLGQTNLLALNATVRATCRRGGQGFRARGQRGDEPGHGKHRSTGSRNSDDQR